MRDPVSPREGDPVTIWARITDRGSWSNATLYYTTDGSEPQGSFGFATAPSTIAIPLTLSALEDAAEDADWVRATIPGDAVYGATVRYRISAWHADDWLEVGAASGNCLEGPCHDPGGTVSSYSYMVRLASPREARSAETEEQGRPAFFKEEAVVGNNDINVQLDRNGTVYDIYYPSAGCVQGVAPSSDGYTGPGDASLGPRGRVHVDHLQAGVRIDGFTYWMSNESGAYRDHMQAYIRDTNVVRTTSRLLAEDATILVDQYDFCPKGIVDPVDASGAAIRGLYIKRFLFTNNALAPRTLDFYYHADFAINGGDAFDVAVADPSRGALLFADATQRLTSFSGEYNPTTFSDYLKNTAVHFAVTMKLCDSVGSAGGTGPLDLAVSGPSSGWLATRLTLEPGQTREIDVAVIGASHGSSENVDIHARVLAPALDWFHGGSMSSAQLSTETWWTGWLAAGTTLTTPDARYDALFRRALLTAALHLDARGGGVISGMHNGNRPYVRPRDAVHTLAALTRAGHFDEGEQIIRFLRDVAQRSEEPWGRGFWYDKYTTDGRRLSDRPQIDAAAGIPRVGWLYYMATGRSDFLNRNYPFFADVVRVITERSTADARVYFDDTTGLMHANTAWDEGFERSIYTNGAIERGLRDAARIAAATNHAAEAAVLTQRADAIHRGVNDRLAWDGDNTDISVLGLVWPFETHSPLETQVAHAMARISGSGKDRFGNLRPLLHASGEFEGLVDRFWGDTAFDGGPWLLSTLWYGQFYARRADNTAGRADIDRLKAVIDHVQRTLGPAGLASDQVASEEALLYPGEDDFRLEAAWPSSRNTAAALVDSLLMFLDARPDAPGNVIRLAPKLPTGWNTLTARNVRIGGRSVDVTVTESATRSTHAIRNNAGGALGCETWIRVPPGVVITSVKQGDTPVPYTFEPGSCRVRVAAAMNDAAGSTTTLEVRFEQETRRAD